MCLYDMNKLEEAEPLMRRSLAINEQSFGPTHPSVGINLNNLALLLDATGRYEEAELLMRRSLLIEEQNHGSEHPNVAIQLSNLALLLKKTNRLEEAEPLVRQALNILVKFAVATGHEHPLLLKTRTKYTTILRAMGQTEEEIKAKLDSIAVGLPLGKKGLQNDKSKFSSEQAE